MLQRYGGFAPLELFSFAAVSELISASLNAQRDDLTAWRLPSGGYEKTMPLDDFRAAHAAPANTQIAQEKSAEEIDMELTEKFDNVKFRRASLDEVKR